jgi:hypothetical protein
MRVSADRPPNRVLKATAMPDQARSDLPGFRTLTRACLAGSRSDGSEPEGWQKNSACITITTLSAWNYDRGRFWCRRCEPEWKGSFWLSSCSTPRTGYPEKRPVDRVRIHCLGCPTRPVFCPCLASSQTNVSGGGDEGRCQRSDAAQRAHEMKDFYVYQGCKYEHWTTAQNALCENLCRNISAITEIPPDCRLDRIVGHGSRRIEH